jgi:hypothetical protein
MIENGVFHVRDVTLGEDGCRVRTGSAAMILLDDAGRRTQSAEPKERHQQGRRATPSLRPR